MKVKTGFLTLSSLCFAVLSAGSFADGAGYFSSQSNSGYSSSQSVQRGSTYYSGYPVQQNQQFEFKRKHFTYSADGRGPHAIFFNEEMGPHWIDELNGYPLPSQAVLGGGENQPPRMLYVCRASYQGGMHPGKIVDGNCNIGWGGEEVRLPRYQVLVSNSQRYRWFPANYGSFPTNAVDGGFENGQRLFICQANWNGGVHPGKVFAGNCNIGYGGKEIAIPNYNILVAV